MHLGQCYVVSDTNYVCSVPPLRMDTEMLTYQITLDINCAKTIENNICDIGSHVNRE